jgi:hypothetical protein
MFKKLALRLIEISLGAVMPSIFQPRTGNALLSRLE